MQDPRATVVQSWSVIIEFFVVISISCIAIVELLIKISFLSPASMWSILANTRLGEFNLNHSLTAWLETSFSRETLGKRIKANNSTLSLISKIRKQRVPVKFTCAILKVNGRITVIDVIIPLILRWSNTINFTKDVHIWMLKTWMHTWMFKV